MSISISVSRPVLCDTTVCYNLQVHTAAEKGRAYVAPPQGHLSPASYVKLRDIPLPHFSPLLSHMLNTFEQYVGHHKKKMKMDLFCFSFLQKFPLDVPH